MPFLMQIGPLVLAPAPHFRSDFYFRPMVYDIHSFFRWNDPRLVMSDECMAALNVSEGCPPTPINPHAHKYETAKVRFFYSLSQSIFYKFTLNRSSTPSGNPRSRW